MSTIKRFTANWGSPRTKKWEIGVLGNATTSGAGVRPLPQNRINFQIDFLPGFERTIQRTGVEIDRIRYYSDTLRRWVNALDPDKPDRKRKFRFKRDPRNVSVIWFYDPDLQDYLEVPTANQLMQRVSLRELEQAKKVADQEQRGPAQEFQILRAIDNLKNQVEQAAAKSKAARRTKSKQHAMKRKTTPAEVFQNAKSETTMTHKPDPQPETFIPEESVQPFDDIE